MTGFEPAQDCSHMDLNHTCLPFHHIREFNIKFMFLARLGQTLRVIPLAKWVALAYCKLLHLCKILRLAASCTARARLCIRFTTSAFTLVLYHKVREVASLLHYFQKFVKFY